MALEKELGLETDALDTKIKKQTDLLLDYEKELAKLKFTAARQYLLLKRNELVEEHSDWTADEERKKTAGLIEEYQARMAALDREVRDLRVVMGRLEENFEQRTAKDPALIQQLRFDSHHNSKGC